jgi:hypothetical protein
VTLLAAHPIPCESANHRQGAVHDSPMEKSKTLTSAMASSLSGRGLLLLCLTGLGVVWTGLPVMGQPGAGIRSVDVSPRPEMGASKPEGRAAELIGRLASESPE